MTIHPALSDSSGLNALDHLLRTQPLLSVSFYPFGAIMRRQTEHGMTEYPVHPEEIAAALATRIRFETGLIDENTLYVSLEGIERTVVGYRPPQKTRIYVDGTSQPFFIPLPGLVMFRRTNNNDSPGYAVFAVKERPKSLAAVLHACPLPNIYDSGGICWGSVRRASKEALKSNSLEEDWALLLGTPFNNHAVHNRSRSHPQDIRKKYQDMVQRKTRIYPVKDLIATRHTIASVLGVTADE